LVQVVLDGRSDLKVLRLVAVVRLNGCKNSAEVVVDLFQVVYLLSLLHLCLFKLKVLLLLQKQLFSELEGVLLELQFGLHHLFNRILVGLHDLSLVVE
jgi:hypothetical protein